MTPKCKFEPKCYPCVTTDILIFAFIIGPVELLRWTKWISHLKTALFNLSFRLQNRKMLDDWNARSAGLLSIWLPGCLSASVSRSPLGQCVCEPANVCCLCACICLLFLMSFWLCNGCSLMECYWAEMIMAIHSLSLCRRQRFLKIKVSN